ncbi:MAG: putative glycosyltransferase EpsD [Acidobacteria bacterium ADurb.Bin051]|nr:MAG: putative glycosyltransferase EpsD [Acidobacteria bacterium ADurb.Bin051]
MSQRVLVLAPHLPFEVGGAEMLAETLRDEIARRGHEVDLVRLPLAWPSSREQLLASALAWRLLDLTAPGGRPVDRVIATKFPSYVVRHPRKMVWLVHQLRQVYDLLGTAHSDFAPGGDADDAAAVTAIRELDRRTLGEARAIHTISGNVRDRLERFNGLAAEVLYPPPRLFDRLAPGPYGEYVVTAGRLEPLKRFDLLVRALATTREPVRCVIAGRGREREALAALAARLGVADRVALPGFVSDDELVALYAGSLAVFYAPVDEDYGFVTVEAFRAAKPMVTTHDAGGVLEFVRDGENGFVCPPVPEAIGRRLDQLYRERELAARLGAAGAPRVAGIGWDQVVRTLLETP